MRDRYKRQVALLIRIMPSVYKIKEFAVHGGTAINLFHRDLPRYSIDIDVTYIPLKDRKSSLDDINQKLLEVKKDIEKAIPGIVVKHKPDVWKLLCTLGEATVKIEVNGTEKEINRTFTLGDVALTLRSGDKIRFVLERDGETVTTSIYTISPSDLVQVE